MAQLPLNLKYSADQRLDYFVSPDAGLIEQLRHIAQNPSQNCFIQGAQGSGKTHLLIATCAMAETYQHPPFYFSLARLQDALGTALNALHTYSLVALDDIDAIAGDRNAELALFDFHNQMHDAGHAILYASKLLPDANMFALPDLRSRLSQCTQIRLHTLDEEARKQLIAARASRRGLLIDDAVIDWLLTHSHRDIRHLTTLLDELDKASLAEQRRLTIPFIKKYLQSAN